MRQIRLTTLLGVAFVFCLVVGQDPAFSQSDSSQAGGWMFEFTPYLLGSGLSGEVGVGLLPAQSVDASFSDLVKVLDFGLMGSFEGHTDNWGFLVDGMYIKLSDDASTPAGVLYSSVHGEMTQQLYTIAGTYRYVTGPTTLSLVGGARYVAAKAELSLVPDSTNTRNRTVTQNWWDGFAGGRVQYVIAENWMLLGYADIGVGGSNLSWQVLGGTSYQFSETWSGKLGYRYISMNYNKNNFLYDVGMGGIYAGVGIRF